ncbi:MAG: YkvA family protein [Aureliella sp.]
MNNLQRMKAWAQSLKLEVLALYLAYRDPRTPWFAKLVAALVVAYALSPIDLIPDPIPVIGYLDDLILLPLGILLARRLIPFDVMEDCRIRAKEHAWPKVNLIAAIAIVLIWLATLSALIYYVFG